MLKKKKKSNATTIRFVDCDGWKKIGCTNFALTFVGLIMFVRKNL